MPRKFSNSGGLRGRRERALERLKKWVASTKPTSKKKRAIEERQIEVLTKRLSGRSAKK
tara:strand:- start:4682 stop:4858 length:177 start_codon:yes stop_codon:yes gene_type:complete